MKHFFTPTQITVAFDIASELRMSAYVAGALSAILALQAYGSYAANDEAAPCHVANEAHDAFLRYAPHAFGAAIAGMNDDERTGYRKLVAGLVWRNATREGVLS